MAFDRISHGGAAVETALSGAISDSDTTIIIADASGWPDGSTAPFYIVIDADLSTEEKVKISARTATTLTVASSGRGADGSTASTHSDGAPVHHTFTALEADEANRVAVATLGQVTAKGDILVGTGTNTVDNFPAGANDKPLVYDTSQPMGVKASTLTVPGGGTGKATVTAHALVTGNGTGTLGEVAPGADGTLLLGQTGADPLMAAMSGDATITAGGVVAIGAGKVTPAMHATGTRPIFVVADATALSALSATEGDIARQLDNNVTWQYDGAAWVVFGYAGSTMLPIQQVALTGGPTSGTTATTLGSITLTSYPFATTIICAAHWNGIFSDNGDMFHMSVQLSGTTITGGQSYNRSQGGGNGRATFAVPSTTSQSVSANTTPVVRAQVVRDASGSGSINTEADGVLTVFRYA